MLPQAVEVRVFSRAPYNKTLHLEGFLMVSLRCLNFQKEVRRGGEADGRMPVRLYRATTKRPRICRQTTDQSSPQSNALLPRLNEFSPSFKRVLLFSPKNECLPSKTDDLNIAYPINRPSLSPQEKPADTLFAYHKHKAVDNLFR